MTHNTSGTIASFIATGAIVFEYRFEKEIPEPEPGPIPAPATALLMATGLAVEAGLTAKARK